MTAHYCPDWDFMWIGDGDPEIEACCCGEAAVREEDDDEAKER